MLQTQQAEQPWEEFSFKSRVGQRDVCYHCPSGVGVQDLHFRPPARPANICFLTSLRDVGAAEKVGINILGTIEATLRASLTDRYQQHFNVVSVIVDDRMKDLQGSEYITTPVTGRPWIYPNLQNQQGQSAWEFTHHIPSLFRSLPLTDCVGRSEMKLAFEKQVLEIMRDSKADLILSDNFMARIDFLHEWLPGRCLNNHPGIIREQYQWSSYGKEPELTAMRQGNQWTGASFHMVGPIIDHGRLICDSENTPILPEDTELSVIARNYILSKNPVALQGLKHYCSNILPMIDPSFWRQ